MTRTITLSAFIAIVIALQILSFYGVAQAQEVFPQLISVNSDEIQGNDESFPSSSSMDGRYVAFSSVATNLVTGDTNGKSDVFVRDRDTGITERVSVATNGTQGNGGSGAPHVSNDGRFVYFISDSTNLVSGDTNNFQDVFVHDRVTGVTQRVSVASDGTQANNNSGIFGALSPLSISSDGRYVVFSSRASNLVDNDTNNVADIFVHDLVTGITQRVSVASDGTESNGHSMQPSISDTGRYVAFMSRTDNFFPNTSFGEHIYVHDMVTGSTDIEDINADGQPGNLVADNPTISSDGRYVAFDSGSSNLITGESHGELNVYLRDRISNTIKLISVSGDGMDTINSEYPEISADGRYLLVRYRGHFIIENLFTGATTSAVFDRSNVEISPSYADLSSNGQYVAFSTYLPNLDPNDTRDGSPNCPQCGTDSFIALNSIYTPNGSPELDSIGDKFVQATHNLQFTVSASDPNVGDTVTFSASNLPSGAVFDPATGQFSWTPSPNQVGSYSNVTFTASDNGIPVLSDTESITIVVGSTNEPPVLNPIGNKSVNEGQNLSFTVSASDPDVEDVVTFSAINLPSGATFDSQTGAFSWMPGFSQAGTYPGVQFAATDNGNPIASSSETITITVANTNRPPVIASINPITIDEGQLVQFTVQVSDPDNDGVTVVASSIPSGANYSTTTRAFSWTPNFSQSGVYTIGLLAVDNGPPSSSATSSVTITVNDISPLTLTTVADSFLRNGQTNRNEGANPHLFVQSSGQNRAVLAFTPSQISNYVAGHGISSAKLILTIASNGNNWGSTGRTIDAHPLTETFTEGNGQDAGLPGSQSTRGTGSGVTWNCATDSAIQDANTDCNPKWNGGAFNSATASSQTIVNNQTGEMEWDVTQDVLNGAYGWLIKKTNEGQNGSVEFYSKEGAVSAGNGLFTARLVLMP